MSRSSAFIAQLTNERRFGPGPRSRLRDLAGSGLDMDTPSLDLFTGLWWPLRKDNQAPRREIAWLVVKLYATFSIPHSRPDYGKGPTLAQIIGSREPPHRACQEAALLSGPLPQHEPARSQFLAARRFRRRFDALLCTPLTGLEPHLRWSLGIVADAVVARHWPGIDWVQLTDDLSSWDRADEHRRKQDIRDIWAEAYLNETIRTNHESKGANHVD